MTSLPVDDRWPGGGSASPRHPPVHFWFQEKVNHHKQHQTIMKPKTTNKFKQQWATTENRNINKNNNNDEDNSNTNNNRHVHIRVTALRYIWSTLQYLTQHDLRFQDTLLDCIVSHSIKLTAQYTALHNTHTHTHTHYFLLIVKTYTSNNSANLKQRGTTYLTCRIAMIKGKIQPAMTPLSLPTSAAADITIKPL